MTMKTRTVAYSVIILIIIVVILFLFREKNPYGGNNSVFAPVPEKEITGIELSDGISSLILAQKNGEWLVNGRNEARKTSIMFITAILKGMEIKSPVSPELFDSEIVQKGIKPVKVKVTERGKVLRSFLVYKTTSNVYGNIMKMRESSKPFIVYVPGNEVEIGSAFTMNELFWQPYSVFNLSPSEISSVSLTSSSDTASSFKIVNFDRKFRLIANSDLLNGWDTTLVRRYVSYFTHVAFESWALDLTDEEVREIEADEPLYRIDIIKSDGSKRLLLLWERSIEEGGVKKKDTDRLWAKIDDNPELCVIRYMDIDPLLKKRSYFFRR